MVLRGSWALGWRRKDFGTAGIEHRGGWKSIGSLLAGISHQLCFTKLDQLGFNKLSKR